MCVKSFKLRQVCSLQCPPVSAIDWGMSSTMIQSEISTSPISTPYGFSKHIKSPPLGIRPSPPASTFASSPPSSGYTSENPERAVRSVSVISALACRKFLPYPRPNMPKALELRFVEKSLRGGAGINIGCDDAKRVFTSPSAL